MFTFYPYKVRKRDFEKHAKTGEFHSSMRASELTAPPGSRRNTNYQLRMPLSMNFIFQPAKKYIIGQISRNPGSEKPFRAKIKKIIEFST